MMLYQA